MSEAAWVWSIIFLYLAFGFAAVTAGMCIRLRAWWAAAVCIAATVCALGYMVLSGLRAILPSSITLIALLVAIYLLVLRWRMGWKELKVRRELTRQAILHLVLVTGSLGFMFPFGWMVVTSLKEDEDMSKFPPVWIPRQQVKTVVDGEPRGLAMATYQGRRVKVAVLKEFESGIRQLRVLEPADVAGAEFELHRKQIEKIKAFAPVWKNYPDALKFLPPETKSGAVFLTNTLWLSGITVLGTILSGSLVAFSFARLRWPGRDILFVVLLSTMMLPGAVTLMPNFLLYRELGWIDSLRPLWVPAWLGSQSSGVNSVFNIFLLRQFFLTIPYDLEDAAKIDGCSFFGIYWRIMLPLIKPALAAVTILTFMQSWNNFLGPLVYVSSPIKMPLSYALALYQSAHAAEPGLLMAAAVMMIVPVILLFFFTQRYFIQGVTLTGMKG